MDMETTKEYQYRWTRWAGSYVLHHYDCFGNGALGKLESGRVLTGEH